MQPDTDEIGQFLEANAKVDQSFSADPEQYKNDLGNSDDDEHSPITLERAPIVPGGVQIFYHAGIVNKADIRLFRRMLFRVSKGKVLVKIVDEDSNGKETCPYVLVFQDSSILKMRVLRICDTFAAGSNRDKDAKSVNHYVLPHGGMG